MRSTNRLLSFTALCLVLSAALPQTGEASLCAADPVPAATLLYPFVVYDYNNPDDGQSTVLSITNMSPQAQIVYVQVWSDTAQPVLGFNVVLSGYDMERIDMRAVLRDGWLPQTGTTDTFVVRGNTPEANGPVSHADGPWVHDIMQRPDGTDSLALRCAPGDAGYPGYSSLSAGDLDTIRSTLQLSQLAGKIHNDCMGTDYTIDPTADWWELRDETEATWMYVTADVVWDCSRVTPDQASYWDSPQQGGRAWYQNVLTGDVVWTWGSYAAMDQAVHIEADQDLAEMVTHTDAGDPISFYHRYSTRNGSQSDAREPLPTAWALRYSGADDATRETRLRVWKGSTLSPSLLDLDLSGGSIFLASDCLAYSYWAWDEDENVYEWWPPPKGGQQGDSSKGLWCYGDPWLCNLYPNFFPLAVQEVSIDQLAMPASDGWLLVAWPGSNWDGLTPAPPLSEWADHYQTWMSALHYSWTDGPQQLHSASGTVAANHNCFSDQVLPNLGIDVNLAGGPDPHLMFADGFETGSTSRWGVTVP